MPDNELAKKVFLELAQLNHQGFTTWATAVLNLASDLDLDITDIDNKFTNDCKKATRNRFISSWFINLHNIQANPILRTYMRFKSDFVIEPYLYLGKKLQSREATWWRHQMETLSALLAICAGNSPVPGEFPTQRPVTRSFDVYFDLRPNKRLSKQSWGWWFVTQSRPLWRHRNDLECVNETYVNVRAGCLTAPSHQYW